MNKPVILTGLRANNKLHLGNYLGGLLPIIDIAKYKSEEFQINLFIPDLHSFTTPIDHEKLQINIMDNFKMFAAAGLPFDNNDIYVYRQSFIPAHSELAWILDCFTGIGEMQRMTQFKDKSEGLSDQRVSVGLFNYPVLMAADILLYQATYVPVGDDQSQHIEFTRDIAGRMNKQFGELFHIPVSVSDQHKFFNKDQGLRVKDLQDPLKKMSKSSDSEKGVIFMTDSENTIKEKIMSATTDSIGQINFDKKTQPGISNLIEILTLIEKKSIDEIVNKYKGQTTYLALKQEVIESVTRLLNDFQSKLSTIDENKLNNKLINSEEKINIIANKTLYKVQQAVGLRP